jgi:hypothetical protein
MRRLCPALFTTVVCVLSYGCAKVNPFTPSIQVTIANSFNIIQVGATAVTLNAAVKFDPGNHGVKWSLSLANTGCSPACGTLTPSGSPSMSALYTPPSTTPINQTATVSAVAVDDARQTFTFNFTIQPPVEVSITNKFTTIVASSQAVTVNAKVSDDNSNAGVTWSLNAGGTNCSPACGILTPGAAPSFSASYTPPAVVPAGASASPTITATSVTNTTKNDSFGFSIASANTLVKGSYAFLLRGYDVAGSPLALAGSVTADGNGNITDGEIDINNGGGITHVSSPATGNYTVDLSFQGVPHATFTITNFTFPGSPNHISFKFMLSADGKRGRIVELDGTGYRNVGTIQLQDSTALSAANPAGNYVFGLDSDAPVGGRTVAAGQLMLGANGVTGGLVDESKSGDTTPRYSNVSLAAAPASKPDSSGRGTLTLAVAGTAIVPASSRHYAYYIVNSGQLNLIEIGVDTAFGTVQAGVAQMQKPLAPDSVNMTSVLQMTGMDAVPGTQNGIGPDVIIGVLTVSGRSVVDLFFDSNDLGGILTSHNSGNGIVVFDPNTGRGVISISGGFNSGFVDSAVFYLFDEGEGFIIDADPSTPNGTPVALTTTNNAFSGTFTKQQKGPFNNQSISGNTLFLSGATAIPDIPNVDAAFNFIPTALTYSAAGDLTSLDTQLGNFPNFSINGTYSVVDAVHGHGTAILPQQFFGNFNGGQQSYPAAFYLIGPNRFVLIGRQSGAMSGVSFFDPQ